MMLVQYRKTIRIGDWYRLDARLLHLHRQFYVVRADDILTAA